MPGTAALLATTAVLVIALAVCWTPPGAHSARISTSTRPRRVERVLNRVVGGDPTADQAWKEYLRALLAFSSVEVLGLDALLRLQDRLPLALGMSAVAPGQAFATAVIRSSTRTRTDRIGTFWVDLVRVVLPALLPRSVIAGLRLPAGGVVQDLTGGEHVTTVVGGAHPSPARPTCPGSAARVSGRGARSRRRRDRPGRSPCGRRWCCAPSWGHGRAGSAADEEAVISPARPGGGRRGGRRSPARPS